MSRIGLRRNDERLKRNELNRVQTEVYENRFFPPRPVFKNKSSTSSYYYIYFILHQFFSFDRATNLLGKLIENMTTFHRRFLHDFHLKINFLFLVLHDCTTCVDTLVYSPLAHDFVINYF